MVTGLLLRTRCRGLFGGVPFLATIISAGNLNIAPATRINDMKSIYSRNALETLIQQTRAADSGTHYCIHAALLPRYLDAIAVLYVLSTST